MTSRDLPQPVKGLLLDLQHITDLLTEREEERNANIRALVDLGVSCRTIARFTNLSYKSVHDHFYPKGRNYRASRH